MGCFRVVSACCAERLEGLALRRLDPAGVGVGVLCAKR